MTRLLGVLLLVATSGCLWDGVYSVRGTVWRNEPDRTPLAGASVAVQGCAPHRNPSAASTSSSDGSYDVQCAIGGMCLLLWCPGMRVPDTTAVFAAQGYAPKAVRLLGKEPDPAVSRAACGSPSCVRIDVTLEPEAVR